MIGVVMIAFGSYKLFDNYQIKKQEYQRVMIENHKKEYEEKQKEMALIKKEKDKKTYHEFLTIVTAWNDVVSLADKTPRINLSGPISDMQKIRREAYDFQADECLSPVKNKLVSSMDTLVDFYLTFMSNKIPNRVSAEQANNQLTDISNDYAACLKSL